MVTTTTKTSEEDEGLPEIINDKKDPAMDRRDTDETEASSASNTSHVIHDECLIREAEALQSEERLLAAVTLLKQVQDKGLLEEKHRTWIRWAEALEVGMKDLLQSPETSDSAWKKQSESHGHRDFLVYYQINENCQLLSRIDCAFESSLLLPIISVFNESDLYQTWMPSWKRPIKMGVQETKMLKEMGRGNQIIQVTVNMAWPFNTRELMQHAVAVDVIDEEGAIAVQVFTENEDDPVIPQARPGVTRIDFECTMMFRACPPDHPCLGKSKHQYPPNEKLILISLKLFVDAHVTGAPKKLINFVTRTVLGAMWSSLLHVAEGVRDGKRPVHQEAIAKKKDLYGWIEKRVVVMLDKFEQRPEAACADADAEEKKEFEELEAHTLLK